MAYEIDFSLCCGEEFYQEIALFDAISGLPVDVTGIDHRLFVWPGLALDYGETIRSCGFVIASSSAGQITVPEPGVIAISIPWDRLSSFGSCGSGELSYSLRAVPVDTSLAQVLATGIISFGDR